MDERRNVPHDQGNLSTEHQEKGSAGKMSDTLDRSPDEVHPAREFDPSADVGNPEPGVEP